MKDSYRAPPPAPCYTPPRPRRRARPAPCPCLVARCPYHQPAPVRSAVYTGPLADLIGGIFVRMAGGRVR